MTIKTNYHTHSRFSDGSAEPVEYIEEAIQQGFTSLGFSEHSALPFENTFALKNGSEQAYVTEISRLRELYKDRLEVLLALEADYIPGISTGFQEQKIVLGLDYVIGSVHLVKNPDGELWFIDGPKRETYDNGLNQLFGGDIRKGVTAYWHQINQMLQEEKFEIIGHFDKIKMHNQGRWFNEDETWYANLVNETIDLIAEKGVMVEVNTRGIYKGRSTSLFPGEAILRRLSERNIPVILSSDAHHPSEISLYFEEALEVMKSCGLKSIRVFDDGKWQEQAI